jgi:nucleobase:cation symporter-1, NCS1 family
MTTVRDDAAISATTEIREGDYGDKIGVIEPGGAEFIPLNERHGKPGGLFWTWMSPNFEFATVFVGVLAVAGFGETLKQSIAAIVLGSVLGSVTMGALSARGPQYGVPQMILSRISFGYWGNTLPAGLNALTAGVGWFAVNSVSGALALDTLLHLNKYVCLVIIVAAGSPVREVRLPAARGGVRAGRDLDVQQGALRPHPAGGLYSGWDRWVHVDPRRDFRLCGRVEPVRV